MSPAKPDVNLIDGERSGLYPTPYPKWVWVVLSCLVGAYAGWWGSDIWGWTAALILIGAIIVFGGVGAALDSWRRAWRQVAHPWRWLFVALAAYGIVGGLVVGVFYWWVAVVVATCVGWIPAWPLRVAAGFLLALAASGLGAWQVVRRRAKRQHNDPEVESNAAGPNQPLQM
jgi:hypothetical protein